MSPSEEGGWEQLWMIPFCRQRQLKMGIHHIKTVGQHCHWTQ